MCKEDNKGSIDSSLLKKVTKKESWTGNGT
jgi:hypothetical protein